MRITKMMKICLSIVAIAILATIVLSMVACKTTDNDKKKPENNIPEDPLSFGIKAIAPGAHAINNDSPLSASFAYSSSLENTVQGFYADPTRHYYALVNTDMSLVHTMDTTDKLSVRDIANKDGISYAHDTLDVYLKGKDGTVYSSAYSPTYARMNTVRLGYYYYETHIRELGFGEDISESEFQDKITSSEELKIDTGWTVNQMSNPEYKNGTVTIKATDTHDPYCCLNNFEVAGEASTHIEVTINSVGQTSNAELFIATTSGKGFNAEQRVSFGIVSDGTDRTYRIDLSSIKGAKEGLVGVRFDFGQKVGDTFTIKSIKVIGKEVSTPIYKLDKTFHVYSDKVHQEYRLVKSRLDDAITEFETYGIELKIPLENVLDYKVSFDENGQPEYVAASVKYAGVIGFIIPKDELEYNVTAQPEGEYLVIRQEIEYNKRILTIGSRIYNDETNSFDGIAAEAKLERNPLTQITAESARKVGAKYIEYDPYRGSYHIKMGGSDFNAAYKNRNEYFTADVSITNDTGVDRSMYIWTNSITGALEGAAVVDSNGLLTPINPQVCKNFSGEKEEPFYEPADTGYGDSFIPLKISAGQTLNYSIHHLYQNWGKFPLKQISSIQFHISYYHLSTGVTESNCIAPYFVYGKDQWTLPDFRGCSGTMWASQPQFNAVGRLRFASYVKDNITYAAEYTDTDIRSSGNTYADMDYNYISDCGSYEYTLRHVEFPQDDENRTYYTMDLNFLKDLTIEDVKTNFTLFSFDGRAENFDYVGYTDENGNPVNKRTTKTDGAYELLNIGNKAPYFTYYGLNNANTTIMNFAYIMVDYDIVIGGEKWNGDFAFRNAFNGNLNYGDLSLMEDTVKFKKGDYIRLDFILVPWGTGTDTDDSNVQYVRQDSVFNKLKITAQTGTVVEDTYIPIVKADNNAAEFTLSGGRNRFTVRIDGITSMSGISIQEKTGSGWTEYVINEKDFDGYQINYNEDGTYSYSFVVEMDDNGSARTFKVNIK